MDTSHSEKCAVVSILDERAYKIAYLKHYFTWDLNFTITLKACGARLWKKDYKIILKPLIYGRLWTFEWNLYSCI